MLTLILRAAVTLLLLCAGLIGVIRAQPYDDGGLSHFLFPQPDCPMPCWYGIRPGQSTPDTALKALATVPDVYDIGANLEYREGQVYWRWRSGAYHFLRDTPEFAHTWVVGETITNIYLNGFRRFADLRLLLGPPEEIIIHVDAFLGTGNVVYLSVYPGELYVAAFITCDTRTESLWQAHASVNLGESPEFTGSVAYVFDGHGSLPRRLCSLR